MSKKNKNKNLSEEDYSPVKAGKKKKHRKFWLGVKICFLFMLLAVLAAVIVLYVKYGNEILRWQQESKSTIDNSTLDTFKASETSLIYASDKSVIAKLKGDKDSYYLTFEKIPKYARDAMVVSEDREFYKHEGVNFLSTMKAAVLLVKSKLTHEDITRGGSTITQQLAKNVFLTNQQTYERKVREIFMALELEKRYTKDQIIEFYMNNIYFANGYYGIEAASRGYFSKSASELSLAQIAFLCSIPNNPNLYNPLDNYSNTVKRKSRILSQMLEAGVITAAEYSDANYEEIILDPAESIKTQNYMTTYAISCATKAIMQAQGFKFKYEFDSEKERKLYNKEYDTVYNECYNSLYTGGYRIYTSLSKKKQKLLQSSVNDKLSVFKEKNKKDKTYKLQGAATCIDNETGFVVAIVGGRKQKSITGYTLNRAYQSFRQPGSCFKPLVVYTPQLERGYT
ncbi:MAG: penicillin-binding protein, partial [Lachnospiraceae bacterium]|nr:penicillin-binding protein [Lachnospiraceae bacterium]